VIVNIFGTAELPEEQAGKYVQEFLGQGTLES